MKVKEPNKWKQKQVHLWELAHNEKVKKGEVVIFLDGNTRNFEIKNLYKISRGLNVIRNAWYGHIKGINGYQLAEIKHLIKK